MSRMKHDPIDGLPIEADSTSGLLAGPTAILPFVALFALAFSFALFLAVIGAFVGFSLMVGAAAQRSLRFTLLGTAVLAASIYWISQIV